MSFSISKFIAAENHSSIETFLLCTLCYDFRSSIGPCSKFLSNFMITRNLFILIATFGGEKRIPKIIVITAIKDQYTLNALCKKHKPTMNFNKKEFKETINM